MGAKELILAQIKVKDGRHRTENTAMLAILRNLSKAVCNQSDPFGNQGSKVRSGHRRHGFRKKRISTPEQIFFEAIIERAFCDLVNPVIHDRNTAIMFLLDDGNPYCKLLGIRPDYMIQIVKRSEIIESTSDFMGL